MRFIKNEKGMALITVILIFTVFSVLGLVIFSSIMTNMKQITKTEESVQATDLAEMGIVYYKNAIEKSIVEVNELKPESIENFHNQLRNKLSLSVTYKKKKISGEDVFFEALEIPDFSAYNPPAPPQAITSNNISTYVSGKIIGVIVKSKGYVKGKVRELSLHLKYNVAEKPGGNFGISEPTLNLASGAECSDPSQLSNENCVYTSTFNYTSPDGINNINDAILYFNEDFNVTASIVNVKAGRIHVEGDFNAGTVSNWSDDTGGKTTTPSVIEVMGDANIGTLNNTSNNFKLIVGGTLTIGTLGPTIEDTIIVALNTLNLPSTIASLKEQKPYTICAFGTINGYKNISTDRVLIPGEKFSDTETFESVCGIPYKGKIKISTDGTPSETIEYD